MNTTPVSNPTAQIHHRVPRAVVRALVAATALAVALAVWMSTGTAHALEPLPGVEPLPPGGPYEPIEPIGPITIGPAVEGDLSSTCINPHEAELVFWGKNLSTTTDVVFAASATVASGPPAPTEDFVFVAHPGWAASGGHLGPWPNGTTVEASLTGDSHLVDAVTFTVDCGHTDPAASSTLHCDTPGGPTLSVTVTNAAGTTDTTVKVTVHEHPGGPVVGGDWLTVGPAASMTLDLPAVEDVSYRVVANEVADAASTVLDTVVDVDCVALGEPPVLPTPTPGPTPTPAATPPPAPTPGPVDPGPTPPSGSGATEPDHPTPPSSPTPNDTHPGIVDPATTDDGAGAHSGDAAHTTDRGTETGTGESGASGTDENDESTYDDTGTPARRSADGGTDRAGTDGDDTGTTGADESAAGQADTDETATADADEESGGTGIGVVVAVVAGLCLLAAAVLATRRHRDDA